ncbi:MAG TPA: hypothetical protein VIL09_19015 [Microvirga sp.]|jgi:hypothetical protein
MVLHKVEPISVGVSGFGKAFQRREDKARQQLAALAYAGVIESGLWQLCGGSEAALIGAMILMSQQYLKAPHLLREAEEKGLEAMGWYRPSPFPPQVVGLLVSLPPEPSPELMAQLQRDRFVRYSDPGVQPVTWAGTGDRVSYNELAGRWNVTPFEPARGMSSEHERTQPAIQLTASDLSTATPLPPLALPSEPPAREVEPSVTSTTARPPARSRDAEPTAPVLPATPYIVAAVTPDRDVALHEADEANVEAAVLSAVRQEGPMEEPSVVRAVREGYKQKQAGERSQGLILAAVERLIGKGTLARDEGSVVVPNVPIRPRDRTGQPDVVRDGKHLPPPELRVAILELLAATSPAGLDSDTIIDAVAKRLGYQICGARLAKSTAGQSISAALGRLLDQGRVSRSRDGRIVLAKTDLTEVPAT